ncbi:MAG: hypothetical protein ACI8PZ_000677 [Myxococcota bacterium]|jgi:hypothetical protein
MTRVVVFGALFLVGCSGGLPGSAPEPEPDIPEKCRNIHVDRLAGSWISLAGNRPDHKTRMRVLDTSTVGGDYEAWYVGGFWSKIRMKGEKREADVKFTEVPTPDRAARVAKGEAELVRLYVKPRLAKCALEVFIGKVDGADKETIPPRGTEFLTFPPTPGVEFSYRPPDRELFLGDAAKDRAVATAQVEEIGHAKPDHEMGTVPVGLWATAEADGPADCTYTMDLFFDHQRVDGGTALAAGDVIDGYRPWLHEWEAPYSGNHQFEMHRYRQCGGGERELIDVAAIEAVLQ